MPLPIFVKTARTLFLLAVLVVGWCAALWFLIAPDFTTWSLPRLAAVHAGPPVFAWSAWCWWRRRQQQRNAAWAVRQDELAARERQAVLEAARIQHAAEQRRLQFGCDCLGLAMVTTVTTDESPASAGDFIHVSTIDKRELTEASDLLEHLHPGIDEALSALYSQCAAAAHFPIYLSPPADISGEAVIAAVRQVQARFLAGPGVATQSIPVVFLPQRDSAADSLIGLFETNPELPGAVILAFDSPWWRAQRLVDDATDGENATRDESRRWLGAPGQGVIALFVAHPELPAMLTNLTRQQRPDDPMMPYWERLIGAAAPHPALARLNDLEHDALRGREPLARIHRSALTQLDDSDAKQSLRRGFAQDVATLIERAQIQAAQIDLTLELSSAETPVDAAEPQSSEPAVHCDWLVHNTGGVDCGGPRLASLGVALIKRGFDLDPIEAATNVVVRIGDLGQARSLGMLALAVARAEEEGAVLCAEFVGDERLSLFFAQPPAGAVA